MPLHRKTLRRHEVPGTARFLTFSCKDRQKLFANDRVKDRLVDHLVRATKKPGVDLFAWVVMPEHVHLVAMLEGSTVESFLRSLKGPFASDVRKHWRALNAPELTSVDTFWQPGGGYDRNVIGEELIEKIRYCHANPIRRGLCATSVDWKWSSARHYESRRSTTGPRIAFERLTASPHLLT